MYTLYTYILVLILVIINLVDFIIPVHVHTTVMMVVPSTCTCSRCSFVHVHTTVMMVVPSTLYMYM